MVLIMIFSVLFFRLTSLSEQHFSCVGSAFAQQVFSTSISIAQTSASEKTEVMEAIFPSQKCTLNANPELETKTKNAIKILSCFLKIIAQR